MTSTGPPTAYARLIEIGQPRVTSSAEKRSCRVIPADILVHITLFGLLWPCRSIYDPKITASLIAYFDTREIC